MGNKIKKSLADLKNDLPIMDSVELIQTKGGANKEVSKWSNNSCGGLLPQ